MKYILMSLIGYLSGSVMWAYLIPRIFLDMDICELSEDHNPGSVNVFLNAGVKWGILVLCCELAKGFLPVMLAKKCVLCYIFSKNYYIFVKGKNLE